MTEATADQGDSEFTVTAVTTANGVRTTIPPPAMQPQTLVDLYPSSDESADEDNSPANQVDKGAPPLEDIPAEALTAEAITADDLSADDVLDVDMPSTNATASKVTHRAPNSERVREIMVPSSSQEDEEDDLAADGAREILVPSSSQEDEEDPAVDDGRVIMVPSSSQEDEEDEEVSEANSSDDGEEGSSSDEASSPGVARDPSAKNEETSEVHERKRVRFSEEAEVRKIPILDSNKLYKLGKRAHSETCEPGPDTDSATLLRNIPRSPGDRQNAPEHEHENAQEIPVIENDANAEDVMEVQLDPVDADDLQLAPVEADDVQLAPGEAVDVLQELEAELENFEEELQEATGLNTEEDEMALKEAEEERERVEQEHREARVADLRRKLKRRREDNVDPRLAVPAVKINLAGTKGEKARDVTEKFYERQRKKRRTHASMPFDDPSTGIAQRGDAMDLEEIQWDLELTAKTGDDAVPVTAESFANTTSGNEVEMSAEVTCDAGGTTSVGSM